MWQCQILVMKKVKEKVFILIKLATSENYTHVQRFYSKVYPCVNPWEGPGGDSCWHPAVTFALMINSKCYNDYCARFLLFSAMSIHVGVQT